MSLTNKQQAFVVEYLKDFNATQAAIRSGYSAKTAYSIGQENLKKPEIMAALDAEIMSAEEAALNISEIARGDMADLMAISTSGFSLELLIRDPVTGELVVNPKTKLIKKIKQKVTTFLAKKADDEDREVIETEIELYSRHDANRDILKYRGRLVDRTDITTKGEKITDIGVRAVDYRSDLTALAPGSIPDSDAPSQDENIGDGQEMG